MSDMDCKKSSFEHQVFTALKRSAELAREDAIKTNTAIVVRLDDQLVEIPADKLKKQAVQDPRKS